MAKELFKLDNLNKIYIVLTKKKLILCLFLFIIHLMYSVFIDRNIYYIFIGQETNNQELNIFTRHKGEPFKENKKFILQNKNRDHHYYGRINSITRTDEIRVDIGDDKSILQLYNINFKIGPYKRITLERKDIAKLSGHNIEFTLINIDVNQYKEVIEIKAIGPDPYFVINAGKGKIDYIDTLVKSVIWTFLSFLILYILFQILSSKIIVTKTLLVLSISFMAVLILSKISPINANPDEIYGHLPNCFHYTINTSLPDLEKEYLIYLTEYPWGFIRSLNFNNIYYFLNGKCVTYPVIQILFDFLYSYRLLNVCLYASILYFVAYNKSSRYFFIPLVFSAQVIYIGSYTNDDFFSLYLCSFAAYFLIIKQESKDFKFFKKNIIIIVITMLILFSKLNFYLSLLSVFFYYFLKNKKEFKQNFHLDTKRFTVNSVIVISLLITKFFYHYDSADQQYLKDLYAHPEFKNELIFSNLIEERLQRILSEHYFYNLFKSSFGNFGMMNIEIVSSIEKWAIVGLFQTNIYYILILIALSFLIYKDFFLLLRNNKKYLVITLIIFFVFNLILCVLYSLFNGIQYQGRYLFPIIPLYCILFYECRKITFTKSTKILISILVLCTLYFVYFYGIERLINYNV